MAWIDSADAPRFVRVEQAGRPVLILQKPQRAGAGVAHQQEGRGAAAPAFADVGAHGLFADRVQVLAAEEAASVRDTWGCRPRARAATRGRRPRVRLPGAGGRRRFQGDGAVFVARSRHGYSPRSWIGFSLHGSTRHRCAYCSTGANAASVILLGWSCSFTALSLGRLGGIIHRVFGDAGIVK